MATKTRTYLVNSALGKLVVVGVGQSADAEDYAKADAKFDELIDQLSDDNVCQIANPDEIPAAWCDALASLLANICANDFGKPYSEDAKRIFEAQLRRLTRAEPTYETLRANYY